MIDRQVEDMMDGMVSTDLKDVVAPLNFLAPMAEKPVAYNYEPPPGTPARTGRNVEHRVTIRDARPMIGRLSLDREGFVLLHHQTTVTNFYDEEQITRVYYPECERVMKEATGASRVVAFDHIVRNAAISATDKTIKIPAKRVHNDYTAWSSPQRVRDLMGDEAEELLKHRFAINNLWRPIRGPVLESPLTLCDAQSLEQQDLIGSDLKYPD
ncbi:MAG: CmcJ/NvfI family oxidoreductase, partial [Stellaceae bacterium]